MLSLEQIMNLAKANDFTKANAQAIVKEQVDEMVSVLHLRSSRSQEDRFIKHRLLLRLLSRRTGGQGL
jgi:hypothetical protein